MLAIWSIGAGIIVAANRDYRASSSACSCEYGGGASTRTEITTFGSSEHGEDLDAVLAECGQGTARRGPTTRLDCPRRLVDQTLSRMLNDTSFVPVVS